MFGSDMVEVGVGLTLLFLFASLICTAVLEAIEGVLKMRARDLHRGLEQMLGGELLRDFYSHPLIDSLFHGSYNPNKKRRLPSYIPSKNFAAALIDLVARGQVTATLSSTPVTTETLRASINLIPNKKVQRALLTALDDAKGELEGVKANLELWFNGTMDRVSGWYKRRTQAVLFVVGLFAAVAFNLDAVNIARRLSTDEALRKAAVARAESATSTSTKSVTELAKEAGLTFSTGWRGWMPVPQSIESSLPGEPAMTPLQWLEAVLGWLVTALSVTLGAPFWFDVLNKFMVIRATVKPREKSQEEGSEDRPMTTPTNDSGARAPAPARVDVNFEPQMWKSEAAKSANEGAA